VATLGRLSRSAAGAVRAAFEVEAAPGEDVRELLVRRVPEFGTLRVPAGGVLITGALHDPICRSARIVPAESRNRLGVLCAWRRAPVELPAESLDGTVEFRCERLCLDGLALRRSRGEASRQPAAVDTEEEHRTAVGPMRRHVAAGQALVAACRLHVEALLTCRGCDFEAEVALTPPLWGGALPPAPVSLVERCVWSCSPGQGLMISGVRLEPGSSGDGGGEEELLAQEEFATEGLKALRRFAGELEDATSGAGNVVVPNGRRPCVVRDCEAHNVRHHALFLRWDVFVLLERCALHGKILIEEGPSVVLRRNQHLTLQGEVLDPEFVGTLLGGHLVEQRHVEARGTSSTRRRSQGTDKQRSASLAAAGRRRHSRASGVAPSGGSSWQPAGGVATRRRTVK